MSARYGEIGIGLPSSPQFSYLFLKGLGHATSATSAIINSSCLCVAFTKRSPRIVSNRGIYLFVGLVRGLSSTLSKKQRNVYAGSQNIYTLVLREGLHSCTDKNKK